MSYTFRIRVNRPHTRTIETDLHEINIPLEIAGVTLAVVLRKDSIR